MQPVFELRNIADILKLVTVIIIRHELEYNTIPIVRWKPLASAPSVSSTMQADRRTFRHVVAEGIAEEHVA
ncbi:unnamed protein product [Colias eurytheme]|nr:unnamed protein product [Colias eurytheme]